MKIAILGTRGIPNNYGGFEQCAQFLALGFVNHGHEVFVYNSHNHPFKEKVWEGVNIIHCFDPEHKLGTAGQFIYDLNCIRDSRKRKFDVILQLGYTSSSVWGWLLPRKPLICTNMDGLEWKRSKYPKPVQRFLRWAEKLAVRSSDRLIADSTGIQHYLNEKYHKNSAFIPYGAAIPFSDDLGRYQKLNLDNMKYYLLIARMEPENNIEKIIHGYLLAGSSYPLIIVGKLENKYARSLLNKYSTSSNVRFVGGIYDQHLLNSLRQHSLLYFHGHSVGGTNPSLLEAMASGCMICAHDNIFNNSVLGNDGMYFKDTKEIIAAIIDCDDLGKRQTMIDNNLEKIRSTYNWEKIIESYLLALNYDQSPKSYLSFTK